MLEIGEPDDPAAAVRASHLIRDRVALEPEHPAPAPGEVEGGRASHPTDAGDDHVVPVGH